MEEYINKTPKARIIMKLSDKLEELFSIFHLNRNVLDEMAGQLYDHAVAQDINKERK